MFEELKKKALKSTLAWSIILIIGGVVLAGWNAMDAFYSVQGGVDFSTLGYEELGSQIVNVDLEYNFGRYLKEYSHNTKTNANTTTDYYYVIPAFNKSGTDFLYMTIKVPASYGSRMDTMANNTADSNASSPINFRGKIKKLDSEELDYFNDYFEEAGFTASEIADGTLPVYIDAFAAPSLSFGLYIILFAAGVVLFVYGIYRIASAASGGSLKKMHQDIANGGFTEASIESDYRNAQAFDKKGDLKVGKLMTYYTAGSIPRALPNSKIMWAYQNTVTHRTNGVKTGTTYNVMVYDELAPKGRTFSVANETVAQDILNLFHASFPWVVVGYSDELKKLYNKDRVQFLQLRYNTCEHTAVEPGSEN
ncbi:MAG: hypothetical protein HFH92_02320 [Lachnospiraceae bacterium]|uniref:DUF6709 family protein n=1 Tax=uncultured Acetatifactor sp. TaxID=1671927 RepID=UPI0026398776|nr:DUF6709 family protein [uncultured Acetatifactor sp.]MCI8787945.1 hypothetical protein [Lachnospiraceae bacterium]